jgi:hypothetical protein
MQPSVASPDLASAHVPEEKIPGGFATGDAFDHAELRGQGEDDLGAAALGAILGQPGGDGLKPAVVGEAREVAVLRRGRRESPRGQLAERIYGRDG